MKWPEYLMMIRHDVSVYNILKAKKLRDPSYREFMKSFEKSSLSNKTRRLAHKVWKKFRLNMGDHDTPLVDAKSEKAEKVGKYLRGKIELPDIIFVSPYDRTLATLDGLKRGWPELVKVKYVKEERIREQGHGIALIYNDLRVFQALNPKQKLLLDIEGPYFYQYPQGENVPDVRSRNRSWLTTLTRDYAEKKILVITHHLNILATRANLERWESEEFIRVDKEEKPVNCGITLYRGNPNLGKNGKLIPEYYNRKFF